MSKLNLTWTVTEMYCSNSTEIRPFVLQNKTQVVKKYCVFPSLYHDELLPEHHQLSLTSLQRQKQRDMIFLTNRHFALNTTYKVAYAQTSINSLQGSESTRQCHSGQLELNTGRKTTQKDPALSVTLLLCLCDTVVTPPYGQHKVAWHKLWCQLTRLVAIWFVPTCSSR